jgi:hypothetical protein
MPRETTPGVTVERYLGDGVYVGIDPHGYLALMTKDGVTNLIFLEPEVYAELVRYAEELKAKAQQK